MSPQQRLVWSLVVLIGVFAVGATGYVVLEGASLMDAVYMTAITLSTVGYREVIDLSPRGEAWTIAVITLGVISVSVAFTSLVALFVSGELRAHFGSRKMDHAISRLKDHIVICGFGRMGRLAGDELHRAGQSVVVIEVRPDRGDEIARAGLLGMIGDATEEDTLLRAGMMHAKALVSVLPHDADNVYVALTARGLRPDLLIVARAEQANTEVKLRRAGANRVICPQLIGASRIADILMRPHVTDFFEVAAKGVELEMDEYVVGAGSSLNGTSIRHSTLRQRTESMIVAIRSADGTTRYNPPPETRIRAGDTLIIIGPSGVSKRLDKFGARHAVPPDPASDGEA